ncbi:MAG: glycosyltransferase family 2 protein [Armatimonadota bacterium]|nr:glycosyltransferase family 2 protein [Armatimonadota bacterium]
MSSAPSPEIPLDAGAGPKHNPHVSVVVPIYNEADGLLDLHARLSDVMEGSGLSYEIVYINDGSSDNSGKLLRGIHAESPHVKFLDLLRNSGQVAALSAGFAHIAGDIIVTMDGDGQMEPEDIPLLVREIEEGSDVVSGWRTSRRDSWFGRALPSMFANYMIRKLSGVPMHDYGCSLKAYRRELVDALKFDEYRAFNQAVLISLAGKWAEIPVRHYPRPHGKSKWNLFKLFQFNLDNLVSLSVYSFQWMAIAGAVLALIGLLLAPAFFFLAHKRSLIGLAASLNLALSLVGVSTLGILVALSGEFVVRIYHMVDKRPKWILREILEPRSGL